MSCRGKGKGPARCPGCPFGSRTVGDNGPRDAPFVVVGESPGATEVAQGAPFVGPSGQLLDELLREVGLRRRDVYVTNAIVCLPPRSKATLRGADGRDVRKKDALINDACRACRERLLGELGAHRRSLVLTMGNGAVRAVCGEWNLNITPIRGQLREVEIGGVAGRVQVLPTYHPAHVLRNATLMPQIRSDMVKAKRLLVGAPYPKPQVEYRVVDNVVKLTSLLATWRASADLSLVADIETTGLDRQRDAFRCLGVIDLKAVRANGRNVVWVFPGRVEGFPAGALVKKLFAGVPKRTRWIWHNGKFDTSFLRAKGLPRTQVRVDEDTLLLSYALDETGGRHGLEQCIVDHLGLPAYKDGIRERMKATGTTWRTVDRESLWKYMAQDVVYTALLYKALRPKVKHDADLERAYTELLVPAANTLASIELAGMPIDVRVLASNKVKLEAARADALGALHAQVAGTPWAGFNPNAPHDLKSVLTDKYRLKVPDTRKETLEEHSAHPFVSKLLAYRKQQKMLSTYITAFEKYGSRVHTSYLLHGTVTGRLSSADPNMQNIPKNVNVRSHFKTPRGRIFLACDYAQAELRSLAVLSGDERMLALFRNGEDMHSDLAAFVYKEAFTSLPEEVLDVSTGEMIKNAARSAIRDKAKRCNFGIVYGATASTLVDRIGISMEEATLLVDSWYKRFPRAKEFMYECRRQPVEGRPLSTVFGRKRRFYLITNGNRHSIENEAGNFPHQSMCSDFTLRSAIVLDGMLSELPGRPQQVNIIHDDNMFEVDNDPKALASLAKMVTRVMEETPVKMGVTGVHFETDILVGEVWCAMAEYTPPKE